MIKQCIVCDKSFKTYPSKVKIGRGKYCSKACSNPQTLFKKGRIGKASSSSFKYGELHSRWKGWRYCGRNNNYREIRVNGKYIREHRFVMQNYLQRKLSHDEEVHHIDGNGLNNNLENLQLMKNKHEHLILEHKNGKYTKHLNHLH